MAEELLARSRLRRIGPSVLLGVLVGGVLTWAVLQVFAPPAKVQVSVPYTTSVVAAGSVESSITLNTSATWKATVTGRNRAAGTVTTVPFDSNVEAAAGVVLYTVDMRPVSLGAGSVPAYRDLAQGASGEDVAQLQGFLAAVGTYSGQQDGSFGSGTASAVRAWQKSLGLDTTGVVSVGDIIYVPSLPGKIVLDVKKVTVGASLGGGEEVVSALGLAPDFTIAVTDQQSRTLPLGTQVVITAPDGQSTWSAKTVDVRTDENQQIWLVLASTTDQPICGDQCATVPATGENLLTSQIVITPKTEGLVVPTAAIKSNADGQLLVVTGEGEEYPVSVVASARGMSVITGVDEGLAVRVPAQEG